MGIRYRKKIKILPGVSLNIGKNGLTSATIGKRGASINIGSKGTYVNTGIPGSGLSARTKVSSTSEYNTGQRKSGGCLRKFGIFVGVVLTIMPIIDLFYEDPTTPQDYDPLFTFLVGVAILVYCFRNPIQILLELIFDLIKERQKRNEVLSEVRTVKNLDKDVSTLSNECEDHAHTIKEESQEINPTYRQVSSASHLIEPPTPVKEISKTCEDHDSIKEDSGPYDPKNELNRYVNPPTSLLGDCVDPRPSISSNEIEELKARIIQILKSIGITTKLINVIAGPSITFFEIIPAPNVAVSVFRKHEEDIIMSLCPKGGRLIAPIPGKFAIGLEIPNSSAQVVPIGSLINSKSYQDSIYELPVALGISAENEMLTVDLAKLPHVLIAGNTGQGKTSCLNTIIISLLLKKHPADLKFLLIDTKKIEFSIYEPIGNNFLAQLSDSESPIITDVSAAITALESLCHEMDARFELLKSARCRNIKEYNRKFCDRHLLPTEGHKFLPNIVVVIDEFAELMTSNERKADFFVMSLAQRAHIVGIHVIISTQNYSSSVISNELLAKFLTRIVFRTSHTSDDESILGVRGGTNLIGRGDMLFQADSELTRVQCAFVDTPEIVAVTKHIESQQSYSLPYELPLVTDDSAGEKEGMSNQDNRITFEQVASFVVNTQSGSTSKIQRQFSVGFNRAGRLMEQLEEAGIVGPQMGNKPRQVLVQSEIDLQQILAHMKEKSINFDYV